MALDLSYDPNWKPKADSGPDLTYDPKWTPPPKPEGGLIASLKQTGGQLVKSAGQAAADFLPGVAQDNALKSYGQAVIDANPTAIRSLSDVAASPWMATKEAVGNAVGSMGAMVGAQALGKGIEAAAPFAPGAARPLVSLLGKGIQLAGPTVTAALPSYGGIRDQQIQDDPTRADSPEAKARAALGAGAVGLIETSFGPERWALAATNKAGRAKIIESLAGKSLVGSIGKGMAKGAAVEGAEEVAQNPIEQIAGYQDPTTAANLQDTAFSGVMGALGGGVLGGAGGGVSYAARPEQPKVDPAAGPMSRAAAVAQQTGADTLAQAAQQAQGAEGGAQATQPAADPLAELSARLTPQNMRAIRTAEGYGPESVDEVLRAYQIARNPQIDPTLRQQATEALNAFWQGFDNRPNWTRPNPQAEQPAQPGTDVVPFSADGTAVARPGAPSPFDPNTLEGNATEIAGTLPGSPRQLVGPEKRFLEAPDRMQAKRAADAEYEQAYQDLVKAEQLGASDRDLLAYQQALREKAAVRDELAAGLADVDARVSGSMEQQSAEGRRSLLDSILNDPETRNPLPRFESVLKKSGYAQRRATPEERQAIERFQSARDAFTEPDRIAAAPNEMDAAAMGIRERVSKVVQPQPAPAAKPQRAAFPMTETGAQRQAAERTQATGQPFEVVPHPTVKGRFAVQASQQAQPTELNVTTGAEPAPSLASSGVTLTNEGGTTPTNALLNSGEIGTQGDPVRGTETPEALAPTQERGTAQQAEVTQPTNAPAADLNDALRDRYNALVREWKGLKEAGDEAGLNRLYPTIEAVKNELQSATMQRSHQEFKRAEAQRQTQRRAENEQTYGAMPDGTKIGIGGYEQSDDIYWEKIGPNRWERVWSGRRGEFYKTDAEMDGKRQIQGTPRAPESAQTLPEDRQASRPQGAQAGAQEPGQGVGGFVKTRTVYGDTVHVRQSDLDGDRTLIPMFTADGKPKFKSVHRENLDPDGSKQAAQNAEAGALDDVVTTKDGKAFANKMGARREQNRRGLAESHDIVPGDEVQAGLGGFVLKRKAPAAQQPRSDLDTLQAEYDTAKSALDAIGPEPYQPRVRGSNPSAEDAQRFDDAQKKHAAWRRKYLRLKKAEVDASNQLFRAKQEAAKGSAEQEAEGEIAAREAGQPTPANRTEPQAQQGEGADREADTRSPKEVAESLDAAKIKAGYQHRALGGLGDKVQMERKWFADAITKIRSDLSPLARNDAQKAKLEDLIAKFADEYKERRYRVMDVGEGAYSAAVAGASNFNNRQAQQRGNALTKAEESFNQWLEARPEGIKAELLRLRTDDERTADHDAAESARVKKLVSAVVRDLAMIGAIDEGQAPGMDRASFANGAARKIANLHKGGESAALGKVFDEITKWDASHKKPLFTARSPIWKYRADNIQRSFAGESARTADTHALATAQSRIAAGEDAETVRQENGWFKGADGRYRFEIDDSDAAILPALQSLGRGGYAPREIASVTYRKRDDGTYDLTLNPPNPKETSDFVTLTAVRPEVMRAVLPDAAAQAVERNAGTEDFIGNFEEAKRIDAAFTFDGFNALPLDQVIDHPALFAAYPALREVMVQVDPKLGIGGAFSLVEHTDGTTTQVIRIGKGQQLSTLLHEIQHGIQDIEGFATGGSITQEIKAAHGLLGGASPVKGKTLEQYAFDRYKRSAGEVEARNTQARQKLTAAERRATSPEATADVKASDVIVVFNGTEMASAPAPANAAPMEAQGTTPDAIWQAVESLVGPIRKRRIVVVQSADVLVEQKVLNSIDAKGAQAFVKDGKAYFIASNIQPGNERAVFLHEVGAHLGMEKILSPFQRNILLTRIKTWAAQNNGSIESRIAQAAQRRVEAAGGQDADSETIAYFVEEAVKAGINPTTDTAGPIGQWFKTLWSAMRTALEKLGLMNPSKLTAQDIVDLAHGAANVAMGEENNVEDNPRSSSPGSNASIDDAATTEDRDAADQAESSRIQFSRAAASIAPVWDVPESSKLFNRLDKDSLIYTLQDKHIDTRRVVEAIRKQSGDIADEFNPYLQEELFHGRSAKGVKDFLDSELRPLLTEMSLRKVDMATLEKFLHARHAEERNIQIAKINPKMPDGGSGMTTQDARDYLAALDPAQKSLLDKLAAKIDAINANTRDLLVKSGLEKPETIKAWEGAYKHYVPLQREEVEQGGLGIGQGFSVKGGASKRAMGSDKAVADIIANIAMQRERAIVRAEKNRVSQALYALALKAPNPEFWMPINPAEAQAFTPKQQQTVIDEMVSLGLDPADAANFVKEPTQRYIDPRTGLVSERINPVMRSAPNVLATRVNGEDRYVFFNAGDERANRMVQAMKNLDADQLGRLLQTSAKLTRWFASVNTQYNPVFGAVNLTRDVQGAILNLSTTPIRGQEAKVLANTFSALKGIYSDLRAIRKGGAASSQWASLWEEFQKEGGQTGYRDMFSNAAERAEAIQKELDQIGEGKLKAGGRALFDWLSDYNESMENAVRLAAYKAAKDQGISAQQAASIAKNLTVNFNRKGQITTQAGALYAFFNASVQGTARIAETLTGPAGRKIILGGLTLGAMQAVMLAAAGFDDDEPPEFVRERSIIIPTGDGKYVSIPMPLGFHVIPNVSRILTEWGMSGFKHTADRFASLISLFADTFNPIGGAGLSMQTLAPTALDPLAALAENKDWSGKPIAREDFNALAPTPGHTRAKDTASVIAKALSYWANLATGGTDYKPGLLSPTPDQIDYLIGQFTGGVGREYLKAEQTAASLWTGEELPPHKIPLLGRFYGDTTGQSSEASRFYANLKEVNQHKLEIEGRRKDGGDVLEYLRDNPASRLAMGANRFESTVSKLRRARRDAVERGDSQDRIKAIDTQITTVMHQFNEQFARLDSQ